MLRVVLMTCLFGLSACAPSSDAHSLQKRDTSISRFLDGSPVDLGSVGAIILVLLAIDVVGTILLGAVFTGRSRQDYNLPVVGELMGRLTNSLDVVEGAMNYMQIEEEACKYKAVCEAETRALNIHPFVGFAINTINSRLPGLERYSSAVNAARNGEDCALIYDQCNKSWF